MADISQIAASTMMRTMRMVERYIRMTDWFKCIAAESPIVAL